MTQEELLALAAQRNPGRGSAIDVNNIVPKRPADSVPLTAEEERQGNTPVTGFSPRGKLRGYIEMPRDGSPSSIVPRPGAVPPEAFNNVAAGNSSTVPGAAFANANAGNSTTPTLVDSPITGKPADPKFTDYESTNPESPHDRDIRFAHTLSSMLMSVGLTDKAAGVRDLHEKLTHSRNDKIGEEAQRAFVAGDITKGIDMFNHAVPNGKKIVGYAAGADGKYTFKMADGSTETKSPDEFANALANFKDPSIHRALLIQRAKTVGEMQKDRHIAEFKGGMAFDLAVAKGLIDKDRVLAVEKFRAEHPRGTGRFTVGVDGKILYAAPDGAGYEIKKVPSKLDPKKMVDEFVMITPPGTHAPEAQKPAAAGFQLSSDMARVQAAMAGR